MKKARPRDASRWSVGIPPLKIFTLAGAEMGSPELSRTVTEISALSPRRTVPSAALSWHRAGCGAKKTQGSIGRRKCTIRESGHCLVRQIIARGGLVKHSPRHSARHALAGQWRANLVSSLED